MLSCSASFVSILVFIDRRRWASQSARSGTVSHVGSDPSNRRSGLGPEVKRVAINGSTARIRSPTRTFSSLLHSPVGSSSSFGLQSLATRTLPTTRRATRCACSRVVVHRLVSHLRVHKRREPLRNIQRPQTALL